jgi:hypothetical protein
MCASLHRPSKNLGQNLTELQGGKDKFIDI